MATSTPKSPLATIIASVALMIDFMLVIASGFSIFAMTLAECPASAIFFCKSVISFPLRTNDNAIQLIG